MHQRQTKLDFLELIIYFIFLGWVFDMFQIYDTQDQLIDINESYIDWDAECADYISDEYLDDYQWEEF